MQDMNQEFYSAYAAGTLDPALQLLVETQAAIRDDVRERLSVVDSIGGIFLESESKAPMSFRALERTLEKIDEIEVEPAINIRAAKAAGQTLDELIRLPGPLQERALEASSKAGWKFAGPGLKIMQLDVSDDVTTELLRIEPGHGAPRHTHEGSEYTLVVSGSFTDEMGTYGPGDISVVGTEHTHRPIADDGEICFALAVRDGDLKFSGVLGVMQRIFG